MGLEYQSGSIEALINMVERGMGYTLVPELAIGDVEKNPHVRRFATPEPVREVSVITHNSFSREKLVEELHRCMLKNIPENFEVKGKKFRVEWR